MIETPRLLSGRSAVVTGGSRGIGLGIATVLAEAGASVVIAARNTAVLDASVAILRASGADVTGVVCDVRVEFDVQRLIQECFEHHGRLDVMVNNAGNTLDKTLRTMTYDDFRAVLDVHLGGAWLGTRAAATVMREQQFGSIGSIGSIAGKVGNIGQTNYCAAKAGMIGLTKAAAKELAHSGIRVNLIMPGLIRTPLTHALSEELWAKKLAAIPMGRAGEPREIGNAALFLASDLSTYMTGGVLEVAGGRDM